VTDHRVIDQQAVVMVMAEQNLEANIKQGRGQHTSRLAKKRYRKVKADSLKLARRQARRLPLQGLVSARDTL
jgi:hypothetical protein